MINRDRVVINGGNNTDILKALPQQDRRDIDDFVERSSKSERNFGLFTAVRTNLDSLSAERFRLSYTLDQLKKNYEVPPEKVEPTRLQIEILHVINQEVENNITSVTLAVGTLLSMPIIFDKPDMLRGKLANIEDAQGNLIALGRIIEGASDRLNDFSQKVDEATSGGKRFLSYLNNVMSNGSRVSIISDFLIDFMKSVDDGTIRTHTEEIKAKWKNVSRELNTA